MPDSSRMRKMPASKAFSIIDQHASRLSKPSDCCRDHFLQRDSSSDTEFSVKRTLPAFMVQWRGGPSPFDSHIGDSTSSAAELWENNVCFDLFVNDEKVPDSALGPLQGHELLEIVDKGGIETCVKKNYFRVKVIPEQVHLNRVGTLAETTAKYNPARDRQRVEREKDAINTDNFFRHLRCQHFKYNTSCLRNYPHGALGIEESPYGNPGEIYGEQQRRLEEAKRRAEHTMRGQGAVPEDHLIGPIKVRNEEDGRKPYRKRAVLAPPCALLGGVVVPEEEQEQKSASPGSLEEKPIRFRSQNVPRDHLMGTILLFEEDS